MSAKYYIITSTTTTKQCEGCQGSTEEAALTGKVGDGLTEERVLRPGLRGADQLGWEEKAFKVGVSVPGGGRASVSRMLITGTVSRFPGGC